MWADTLQHAEQVHLLRVCFWGGISVLAGTALLVLALVHRRASAIIARFASVCVLLGAAEIVAAALGYRSVPLRDLSAATRLDRVAWLLLGLYVGVAAVGITLLVASYALPKSSTDENNHRLPMVGLGTATLLHGIALATLDLLLIADISR